MQRGDCDAILVGWLEIHLFRRSIKPTSHLALPGLLRVPQPGSFLFMLRVCANDSEGCILQA